MNVPDFIKEVVYSRVGADPDGNVFGMELIEAEGNIEIRRKWRGFRLSLLFVAVACTLCSGLAARDLLWPEGRETLDDRSNLIIALIILPTVGIGCGYVFFCHLFNATRIVADSENIKVKHGPLPYLGNKSVPTNRVKGLEVQKNGGTGSTDGGNRKIYYRVSYYERPGSTRSLVSSGAMKKSQAEYIKQNLERFLQALS
jgi:hypothetical protein